MSMPRVPAFQPRLQENRGDDNADARVEGSRVDVLAQGSQLSPIYNDDDGSSGGQSDDAEDQLARLLAGADSGQIKAWAGNIAENNAKKALELFPSTNPLKFIGHYAVDAAYGELSLSEINRRNFGAYVPWIENLGSDMTPLAGNTIRVAGDPFSLKEGIIDTDDENAIPFEWQCQMDVEWREVQLNMGPGGGGSYNRQHLAMGRFSMNANPHASSSLLLS